MPANDPAQPVFRALSDPTRRAIIAMLADSPQAIGDIADQFAMSRPAIAKHLAVLKEGGIITVAARGRERINHLNPAALKTAADWLQHFDRFWDYRLATLKDIVEQAK